MFLVAFIVSFYLIIQKKKEKQSISAERKIRPPRALWTLSR